MHIASPSIVTALKLTIRLAFLSIVGVPPIAATSTCCNIATAPIAIVLCTVGIIHTGWLLHTIWAQEWLWAFADTSGHIAHT